jgi:hypothetical protein
MPRQAVDEAGGDWLGGGTDRDDGDPRSHPLSAAFLQSLQQLGWTEGRNVRIDDRWPAGDADKARRYAAELVALAPDVILAVGAPSLVSLLQATRTVQDGERNQCSGSSSQRPLG